LFFSEGYTHPLPPFMPRGMQLLCHSCWNKDPNARPTFVQLHNDIEVLTRNPTSDAKFPQKFVLVEEKESIHHKTATKTNSSNSLAPLPPTTGGPSPTSTPPQSPTLSASIAQRTQFTLSQQFTAQQIQQSLTHPPPTTTTTRTTTQHTHHSHSHTMPAPGSVDNSGTGTLRGKGMTIVNEQYNKFPLNTKQIKEGNYPLKFWLYLGK